MKKAINSLLNPDSKKRKNLEFFMSVSEFFIAIFFGGIGIYFAITANKLAEKSANQETKITELTEIVTQLKSHDNKLSEQLTESQKQTKSILQQLNLTEKNHSNDSLEFIMTTLLPNITQLLNQRRELLLFEIFDNSIDSNYISYTVVNRCRKLDEIMDNMLDNPIFLIHEKERKECQRNRPSFVGIIDLIQIYGTKTNKGYIFKNNEDFEKIVSYIKNEQSELQDKDKYVWKVSEYLRLWYNITPK